MIQDLCITTLIEDTAVSQELTAEHGLSFWINYGNRSILFDTGQSDLLLKNAEILNIDLASADAIVLSHGHYDHTGGLAAVLEIAPKAKIYLHPAAVELKFSRNGGSVRPIGMSDAARAAIQNRRVIWTVAPARLFSGISVTGQITRINDFEDVGGAFFNDNDCLKSDELLDDQALFIESSRGLIVVLGCAHSGVVNTLNYISKLTGKKKVYALIGGIHLLNANRSRIENTLKAFKKFGIQKVIPLHCTGAGAVKVFNNVFAAECLFLGAGGKICFNGL